MNRFKNAFTMIELIFIIVILGVLASVAIVKLNATQKSARAEVVESFLGTMNRATLPSMYSKSVRTGGSVVGFKVSDYLKKPNDVTMVNDLISSTMCKQSNFGLFATSKIGVKIYCRDGNGTNSPILSFSNTDVNVTLDSIYFN